VLESLGPDLGQCFQIDFVANWRLPERSRDEQEARDNGGSVAEAE
jgi:hypothetical protein